MLMPLAMPARLRTIDMKPVYDELAEEFTMRTMAWTAVFLFGFGVGMATAQAPAPGQSPMGPMGKMNGMEMGQGKCMGMPMNMGHGTGMDMGGMAMEKGQGMKMEMG